jgi:pyruvate formate lyase activating enzyme
MELCSDCAKPAKKKGLKNVFVSNGYMTKQAIDFASEWLDGINIDLKAFSDDYYRNLCSASLKPVLDTIRYIAENTDIWMEITTLVVPSQNDSEQELENIAKFIYENAGENVPWHISRFYPQYQYQDSEPTPLKTLEKARQIAKQTGLKFVYVGNIHSGDAENTYCPACGELLIERTGFYLRKNDIKNGKCPECECSIPGVQM